MREEYSLRIEAMNKELDNANNKGYAGEKETANAILGEVEAEANKILKEDFFREEILVLLGKVQKIRDVINNTLRLADAKPYSELSSNGQPAQAIGLTGLGKTLFAFSPNRLHEVVLGQSMEPKAIDGGEAAVKAAPMEDQEAVVLLTASGRILEYGEGNFTFMSTEDESWKSAVDLAAYGKYLYLLSPQNNQIYKYGRLRSGYSGATEYSKGAQLEGALSMAIDGSVYVLRQGGEIIKLFKSQQEDFRIENLPTSLEGATQIFTSPELKHLYVLDPGGKRVLVLQKDTDAGAKYIGQISFEDLEGVKSIFVQKEEDSLFLLAPSAIYQADLKQLY